MLGGFYAAKCVEHCIEKYIQKYRIEGSLRQTKVFGVNVVDTVLNGINYKRSFKGYLILANATEKCDAFMNITDKNQFDGFSATKSLQIAFASKHFEDSKLSYETCSSRCELIKQEFGKFSNIWCGLKVISLLKGCVAAVSEGKGGMDHFYTMQILLPVFCTSGSITSDMHLPILEK